MIYYLGLEPYQERYTELLTGWVRAAAAKLDVPLTVINGRRSGSDGIKVGQVLDAAERGYWATTQIAEFLTLDPAPQEGDWVWIDDMFHPGIEALPYLWDQLPKRPNLAVRCWAQSVDPDDFTFPMRRWMRRYEEMVCEVAQMLFVASTVHAEMLEASLLDKPKIEVVGLPYSHDSVRSIGPKEVMPWSERDYTVVYSSRLDAEKQPHFFMDMVERMRDEVNFVVCTGASEPRSNDPSVLPRLHDLTTRGLIEVRSGLTKADYYTILSGARVQLNTARQDFVSYTACEASSFDVPTLAPAFRSFPETLENRASQMFVPWSLDDACERLSRLLAVGEPECSRVAAYNDLSLQRMLEALS